MRSRRHHLWIVFALVPTYLVLVRLFIKLARKLQSERYGHRCSTIRKRCSNGMSLPRCTPKAIQVVAPPLGHFDSLLPVSAAVVGSSDFVGVPVGQCTLNGIR